MPQFLKSQIDFKNKPPGAKISEKKSEITVSLNKFVIQPIENAAIGKSQERASNERKGE